MDVDSTLITGEVIEMLAAHAGSLELVTDVTERAMRGELDFTASLHERVATLAGLPVSVFDTVGQEITLTDGAGQFVDELHRRGWPVGLVSGGFTELVRPLARRLGIGFVRANSLQVRDGVLTGAVEGPVIDPHAKAEALKELAGMHGVPLDHAVAIGDGANDLLMLREAGLGVAFNAKPVVAEQADVAVAGGRLDAVLEVIDRHHP
ncbi:phosphoserine phosphatase [Cellulomonas bogoriensis 69B4 = DSM 16987]|uniref:phosphoserine phosphatase n=2 Tax=Cellulomonas bogoriensis TaxID=301388 RepID=A0A0A0C0H4_9CELL|nr:phosphoserine phosphatase [Cellulomonas bogoriensis 69B4 = DSM 16987]